MSLKGYMFVEQLCFFNSGLLLGNIGRKFYKRQVVKIGIKVLKENDICISNIKKMLLEINIFNKLCVFLI